MKGIRLEEWSGKLAILVIPPEFYVRISSELPVELVKEWGIEGVLVSANKPYLTVKESLLALGILDKLIFVDCASRLAGASPSGEKLVLINNPANLTELTISITKSVKILGEKCFLVFDSLTTLLIYSKVKLLTQFAHSLGLMLKANKVTSLFLAVEQETSKEMLSFLSTIADNFVHLSVNEEGDVIIV